MNVGEKIKLRRKELKISADDLADAVGVSRSTIFRYEKGDIEKVGPEVLKKIADKLRISPAELMGWSDETSVELKTHTELDLRKMAENAKTFDGKPLNEEDIVAIQNIIEIYLKGRL
jgi:transcriptional regulator with XRE-family HTH domain